MHNLRDNHDLHKEKKMRRQWVPLFAALVIIATLLGACSSAANTPTPLPASANVPAKATGLPAGSVQINAAGATFPLPLYTEWTYAYTYVDPSVVINYQGIGSGGGKKGIIDGTIDFAGSDSLLSDAEYTSGKDLQMVPMVAGAVVPIYNIAFKTQKVGDKTPTPAPLPGLMLDRASMVGIFSGKISKWNDPAIIALNPGLKDNLPDARIVVVHRSDSSGTTELFTNALASFSPDWKDKGSAIQWATDKQGGIGGKGNPGVAAAVINTPNAIGYVELNYAKANNIASAKLTNKAGKPVDANAASLVSAMNDFQDKFSTKLTNVIVDAPGEGSWPIAGYTYIILHTTHMTDCTKAQKIVEYLRWSLTDPSAGKKASDLGYAVLSTNVQKMVLAKLGEVTCKGQKVLQ
jgi:phosphate transport system substrate-binding protein